MKLALAVFAKTPLPGAVKTRLSPQLTSGESAELYRCMPLDTVHRVCRLPLHVVIFYEGDRAWFEAAFPGVQLVPQAAGGLGERLAAAVVALHDAGYDGSLIIGSDAPDLPLEYLEAGGRQLEEGADAVFGPADDGGYYLVGVRGGDCTVFGEIPWSTSGVLAASLERAAAAGLKAELLPTWYDVDSYEDLLRPGLVNAHNGAPLTRAFVERLVFAAAGRHPSPPSPST